MLSNIQLNTRTPHTHYHQNAYHNKTNSYQPSATACHACPEGTFNPDTKSTEVSQCQKCTAGKFGDERHAIALVLITDVNSADFGANTCKDCPAGQYSGKEGLLQVEECTFCAPGRFSTVQGETQNNCQVCGVGRYGDESAAYRSGSDCLFGEPCPKACKHCGAGLFQSQSGQTSIASCQNCTQGKFAEGYKLYSGNILAAGLGACKSCPRGYYSGIVLAVSIDNCTAWYVMHFFIQTYHV
jgi:hypothetical protein